MYGTPGEFKCYVLTEEDQKYAQSLNDEGYEENIAEAMACENHVGNMYTMGINNLALGCSKCSCCRPRKIGK